MKKMLYLKRSLSALLCLVMLCSAAFVGTAAVSAVQKYNVNISVSGIGLAVADKTSAEPNEAVFITITEPDYRDLTPQYAVALQDNNDAREEQLYDNLDAISGDSVNADKSCSWATAEYTEALNGDRFRLFSLILSYGGKSYELQKMSDDKYWFYMPAQDVTVSASFVLDPVNSYGGTPGKTPEGNDQVDFNKEVYTSFKLDNEFDFTDNKKLSFTVNYDENTGLPGNYGTALLMAMRIPFGLKGSTKVSLEDGAFVGSQSSTDMFLFTGDGKLNFTVSCLLSSPYTTSTEYFSTDTKQYEIGTRTYYWNTYTSGTTVIGDPSLIDDPSLWKITKYQLLEDYIYMYNMSFSFKYGFSNAPVMHNITVDKCEHGTVTSNKSSAALGELVTLSATPDSGYKFLGYTIVDKLGQNMFDEGMKMTGDTFTMMNNDIIVSAVFEKIPQIVTYTVTFNANGGACNTTSVKTDESRKISLLPSATRDNYALVGWYTSPDGGEKIEFSKVYATNTTVFAHWTDNASALILGDADLNNIVNVKDATAIQKCAADVIVLSADAKKSADVNVDSGINVKDATAIQKYVASIATGYYIGETVK